MTVSDSARPAVTDHRGLQVLSTDECLQRLGRASLGRLVFVSAGEIVVLPVNHAVDGMSIVFRTAHGAKLDAVTHGSHVTYEVDDYDAAAETGWSVLVRGSAEVVVEDADIARLEGLGLRSWAMRPNQTCLWIRIRPNEIAGRALA
jgi:uncharacterized protein